MVLCMNDITNRAVVGMRAGPAGDAMPSLYAFAG